MLALVGNDTTIYYNRLLEIELAEIAFKIAVKDVEWINAVPVVSQEGRVTVRAECDRGAGKVYGEVIEDGVPSSEQIDWVALLINVVGQTETRLHESAIL